MRPRSLSCLLLAALTAAAVVPAASARIVEENPLPDHFAEDLARLPRAEAGEHLYLTLERMFEAGTPAEPQPGWWMGVRVRRPGDSVEGAALVLEAAPWMPDAEPVPVYIQPGRSQVVAPARALQGMSNNWTSRRRKTQRGGRRDVGRWFQEVGAKWPTGFQLREVEGALVLRCDEVAPPKATGRRKVRPTFAVFFREDLPAGSLMPLKAW